MKTGLKPDVATDLSEHNSICIPRNQVKHHPIPESGQIQDPQQFPLQKRSFRTDVEKEEAVPDVLDGEDDSGDERVDEGEGEQEEEDKPE